MEYSSKSLWEEFKSSLKTIIENTEDKVLIKAWDSKRTSFYKNELFTKLAKSLNLIYKNKEFLTVDGTFYKQNREDGALVPIVFIESENQENTTDNEINKLCCLNAPLKVLFIACEWNEEKRKDLTEGFWELILHDYLECNKLVGYLGIIVGEWISNSLKYYTFAYGEDGKIADEERLLIEI
jgi:hypothetical protein